MIQELKISFDEESYKAIIGLTNAITKIAEMAEGIPQHSVELGEPDRNPEVPQSPIPPMPEQAQEVTVQPADAAEDKSYTLIEARKLVGEYLKGGDQCRANLEKVLKEFGADMLPDVPREQLGALLKRLGVA